MASIGAHAETIQYSSGTGFYVSRQGHVVTNAHVLQGCKEITLQANGGTPIATETVATDTGLDLALLKGAFWPERPAYLRHDDMIVAAGEAALVIGYPEAEGFAGHPSAVPSHVKALKGPTGEDQWLQFDDAARHGNSGGPLLDQAGNVIGVVTGKAELYRRNDIAARDETVSKSDIAISLPVLKSFLKDHGVMFETRDSLLRLSDRQLETTGEAFVVHVLCRQ